MRHRTDGTEPSPAAYQKLLQPFGPLLDKYVTVCRTGRPHAALSMSLYAAGYVVFVEGFLAKSETQQSDPEVVAVFLLCLPTLGKQVAISGLTGDCRFLAVIQK